MNADWERKLSKYPHLTLHWLEMHMIALIRQSEKDDTIWAQNISAPDKFGVLLLRRSGELILDEHSNNME